MKSQSSDAVTADRGALGMIGLLLGTATVLVTITAAFVVTDYRDLETQSAANLPIAGVQRTVAR